MGGSGQHECFERIRAENVELRARVVELTRENADLRRENADLRSRLDEQDERLLKLEEALLSSKRAAKRQAAPFRRNKRKPKSQHKKPGRKPGHEPAFKKPPKVDKSVDVPLDTCPDCSEELTGKKKHTHYVTDIPPVEPETTEFHTESGCCQRCGVRWVSTHEDLPTSATGAAGVVIGNRAAALISQMRAYMGVSLDKLASFCTQTLGLPLSKAGVLSVLERVSKALVPTCGQIVADLNASDRVCIDETGWRLENESAWAWVFTNGNSTYYVIAQSRGHGVVLDVLEKDFSGFIQSDFFSAYLPLPFAKSKCLAHLLKALVELEQIQIGTSQTFGRDAKEIFKDALKLKTLQLELIPEESGKRKSELGERLDRLLKNDYSDTSSQKLAKRIEKYRDELLVFLDHEFLEGTNNTAERDIRPFVLQRKISAGNKSLRGAQIHVNLCSVMTTCFKRGLSFFDVLVKALSVRGAHSVI